MKGLGCELDDREVIAGDLREKHVARLVGDARWYVDVRDWRGLVDFVPDQKQTSTCVAWAFSSAVYLAGQVAAHPILRPSVRHLYAIGSWNDAPGAPISLGGRSPRRVAAAAEAHGVVAEARWPFEAGPVDEPFPIDLDVASVDARVTGTYTLGGGDLPTQLRVAISQGHFPIIALQVRDSFDDYKGGLYWPNGLGRGWHMICGCFYSPGGVGFLNSWGKGWGDDGYVLIPDEVLAGPEVADGLVVTATPEVIR